MSKYLYSYGINILKMIETTQTTTTVEETTQTTASMDLSQQEPKHDEVPEYLKTLKERARLWLEVFEKNEKPDPKYKERLERQAKLWNDNFVHRKYKSFTANNSALGFLCRALANNLNSVDLNTDFGKCWYQLVRVCIPLLEKLWNACDETRPKVPEGSSILDYIGGYNDEIYLEVFAKQKSKNNRSRDKFGNQRLVKTSVVTLVREILDRVRHHSYRVGRRGLMSDVTESLANHLYNLCN